MELTYLDQAPLREAESAMLALVEVACAEALGRRPDAALRSWLAGRTAVAFGEHARIAYTESLANGWGDWRSMLSDAARIAAVRPTLVTTYALASPLFGKHGIPWLRLDACVDTIGGHVPARVIADTYTRSFDAIEALDSDGDVDRETVGELAALIVSHAALNADADDESAAKVCTAVARQILRLSHHPHSPELPLLRATAERILEHRQVAGAAPPRSASLGSTGELPVGDRRIVLDLLGLEEPKAAPGTVRVPAAV